MSTFKKLIALTLALAMVLSVSAFAGNYKADTYKDAASINEDCEDAVELLYALDIMTGDEKGNFNPDATITRASMAKMIYVILNYGKDDKAVNYKGAKMFSDIEAGSWYEGYVNYCATIKLVQGRGDGTFGPNDPLDCASAAKMLLTAIGYSAEARSYTGANWEKNVLSDAAIVGLMDGYNYPTNTYAPRQWVAVMFENALLGAYTYNKMAAIPGNGLLTSVVYPTEKDIVLFGEKYYDLYVKDLYAYATDNTYIDSYEEKGEPDTKYAKDGYVLFSNGKQFKNTGLGAMDLGQEYRVIARGDKALSVRPTGTSVVAEAPVSDIEYAYAYNKGDSTREFTIGDMTAPFDTAEINAVSNLPKDKGAFFGKFTEKLLMDKLDDLKKDEVKAIDRNGDGDIDYLIITYVDYAVVTKAGTDKSGDYVILDKGNDPTNSIGTGKLWLGGEVESEEELEKGNYVRYIWNLDNRSYDLEVLPVIHDVKYTNKEGISKPVYTIGDEDYQLAAKGFTQVADMPSRNTKVSVVYDDDLAVYVGSYKFVYTTMEDIYNQLGAFVEDFKMNSSIRPNRNVTGVAYYNMDEELLEEEYAGTKTKLDDANNPVYRLVAVETDEDGTYLTSLNHLADADAVRDVLSADEDLIGDYKYGTLNGKKDSFTYENGRTYKFEEDAKFFVVSKSGSKVVVEVKTIADIEEKVYNGVTAELFYSPADTNGRQTIIGGLIDMRTRTYGDSNDYFFIVEKADKDDVAEVLDDDDKATGKYTLEVRVQFSDNTKDDIDLTFDSKDAAEAAAESIKLYGLYSYNYDGDEDVYTLNTGDGTNALMEESNYFNFDEENWADAKSNNEAKIDDLSDWNEIVDKNGRVFKMDDDAVIALTIKRYSNDDHELMMVEHIFTDLEGWEAARDYYSIINGTEVETEDVETFTCYSDFYIDDIPGNLLNIVIYADDLWN